MVRTLASPTRDRPLAEPAVRGDPAALAILGALLRRAAGGAR
jgi:hypothetical protein